MFRLLARQLGREIKARQIRHSAHALTAMAAVFALKGQDANNVFGRFAPIADGQPGLRMIDYGALGAAASPEDDALLCLGFAPETMEALQRARSQVQRAVQNVASALQAEERNLNGNRGH